MLAGVVGALACTVQIRDPYTAGHQERVAELSVAIAQLLAWPEEQVAALQVAASSRSRPRSCLSRAGSPPSSSRSSAATPEPRRRSSTRWSSTSRCTRPSCSITSASTARATRAA
jgi:hypothetical protein